MNSICKSGDPKQSLKLKAKAVATKYQKYCAKKQSQKITGKLACVVACLEKVDQVLRKGWNLLMPKSIRGPITPYQQLMMNISQTRCKVQQQTLPFSRMSMDQISQKYRLKVVLTYTKENLQSTLQKIHNNQQINTLLNKKAQIIPICVMPNSRNKLSYILKQLIQQQPNITTYEQHIFILWKGLFQQLIIIGHFQLQDDNLCYKIFNVLQDREDYQEIVKKTAKGDHGDREALEQCSLNKLEESTGVEKVSNG